MMKLFESQNVKVEIVNIGIICIWLLLGLEPQQIHGQYIWNFGLTTPPPLVDSIYNGSLKLSITYLGRFRHSIKCQKVVEYDREQRQRYNYNDRISLTYLPCSSLKNCDKKRSCIINKTGCGVHDSIEPGDECYVANARCESISPSFTMESALILCATNNSSTKKMIIDYIYQGNDYKSNLQKNTSITTQVFLFDDKKELEWIWNRVVYPNEETRIKCILATFLYDPTTLNMTITMRDGSTLNIDPKLVVRLNDKHKYWIEMLKFRIPKDLKSISCSALGRDPSVISAEHTVIVNTVEPPDTLKWNSLSGQRESLDKNQKLACHYNGDLSHKLELDSKLWPTLRDHLDPKYMTSIAQFIRFIEISKDNYTCLVLPDLTSNTTDFDYFVNILERVPNVKKFQGQNVVTVNGYNHRTLSCKYNGQPNPYVLWLQDGEEILYTIGEPIGNEDNQDDDDGDWEVSYFKLPSVNLMTPNVTNYTCAVYNHLGQSSISFLVVLGADDLAQSYTGQTEVQVGYKLSILFSVGLNCLCLVSLAYLVMKKRKILSTTEETGRSKQHVEEFSLI